MPRLNTYVAQLEARGSMPITGGPEPVDLSGLERLLDQIKESETKVQVADASSKIQAEVQAAYEQESLRDDPHGASERLMTAYDKAVDQQMKNATPWAAGHLRTQAAENRSQVLLRARGFELERRQQGLKINTERGLQDDGRAIAGNPDTAADVMARRLASIRQLELPAGERAALESRARADLAEYAAASLAATRPEELLRRYGDGSPERVSGDVVLNNLPPEKLLEVVKQARSADRLTRSQVAADNIMAAGLPMDEAMRRAEKDYSGEDERMVKVELANRYAYAEAARKDREQDNYGTALLEVEKAGRVSPGTWAKLTDTHKAAVLNRQQAEARQRRLEAQAKPIKTDWALYLNLRQQAIENPEQFARVDLLQHVDKLAGAQLEQLADLKAKNATPKHQREAVTLTQQMNATMKALNITKAEKKGQFQSYVQAEVDAAIQANGGKPLDFKQRQEIIDRAVLQGPDPSAWLWGEKRLFELTPDERTRFKPNAATDAPATEIDELNEALKAQGLPQTPANRLMLYTRAMGASQ